MLPTVTRTAEVVLRLSIGALSARVPSRWAGASGGWPGWSLVHPTARAGLVTAVILGVAHAVGETTPLLADQRGDQQQT